jgi:hypothetical protein
MATHRTWRRRGLAIVAATTVIGSLTIWVTQVATATAGSAATDPASPYFAGAVSSPGLMHTTCGKGCGKIYTEKAQVSFIVPRLTCPASEVTDYALFQYLEGASSETGYAQVYLLCESGTFSAGMLTSVSADGNPTSGGCANVSVAPGDSISYSEQDTVLVPPKNSGILPTGTMEVSASDSTNGESSDCSSETMSMPDGPVYTGICDWVPETGPVPPDAPPPPPIGGCGSTKVATFTPLSFSSVLVDNEPIWHWPNWYTNEYNMYRYRQVGSTLEHIEQVRTQVDGNALDFTFLHH